MALSYCEVCGVLIRAGGQELPEGVICDECFSSRQVEVPEESDIAEVAPEKIQFECPYCQSVLRVAVHGHKRTNIRCPKCTETFYAEPDGSVKSRYEGNTTEVLKQVEVLPELTPSSGLPQDPNSRTRPLDSSPIPGPGTTQPLRRAEMPKRETGKFGTRRTGRLGDGTQVLRPAAPSPGEPILELLPEGVGPKDAAGRRSTGKLAELRASDEGRLSLDTDKLRKKTERFQKEGPRETGKRGRSAAGNDKPKRGRSAAGNDKPKRGASAAGNAKPKRGASAAGNEKPSKGRTSGRIPKRKRASERLDKSSGTIRREERVVAATKRAEEIEAQSSRRALLLGLGWTVVLLPPLLALFVGQLARRNATLVRPNKPVGRALHAAGQHGDRALRSLNDLAGAPIPDLPAERPAVAPLASATATPPDSGSSPRSP